MKKGVVIGGGISGLVAAIHLAARGYEINLLEKQEKLGGKIQEVRLGKYQFDFGPSNITLPWVFERVFREAGQKIDPALRLIPLAVNSRNFFNNGTVIDLTADPDYMSEQLAGFSPENRQGFLDYLTEVQRMYEIAEDHLFEHLWVEWSDVFSPRYLKAFMSVHPFQSMDSFHRRYFDDPRLLAIMNRFATYVGASPYQLPATLSLIGYMELVQGVYYIEGGNYRLIEAFERLAVSLGVRIYTGCKVDEIMIKGEQVTGVRSGMDSWEADFIVSNADVRTTQELLLSEKRKPETQDSLGVSSFLCLFGVKRVYPHLHHHNLFFPQDVGRQYIDIFEQKEWSLSPTIYICNSAFSEPDRAVNGSNLSVLIHVPAVHEQRQEDLAAKYGEYRNHLIYWLENNWGLSGLSEEIEVEKVYGPAEIEQICGAPGGSLYDPVSCHRRTFFRPVMKERKVKGLYYTSGPPFLCGGAAMAALRGLNIAQMIQLDHERELQKRAGK
ncbi:phytoene desaturase family protein [Paenactinomyces guangxiensis]|uniref:4,4'-diaponeurosporene oxygenase n=1 Tax=Paenactinomyces guangxiensis TaxID=1490290 RepID=A0A7W1WR82_9BACL|nr:phytoene desaturase family protein [Paenactinomyces guangxiensis]MBA4494605.1 phytoene desaturase [Paenactinomyces guangxiensis]MBH8591632.1 phytoene desaturase [Paenactinomyces guangxiensis]